MIFIWKPNQAHRFLEQALAELALARAHLDYSFQSVAGLPDDLKGADVGALAVWRLFQAGFPTAGHTISAESDLQTVTVHGLKLPFRFYQAGDAGQSMFVAYCLWEDRASTREFSQFLLTRYARFAPVLAGQRNLGQRSLEIGITGVNDFSEGRAALQTLLEKIITPSP